MPSQWERFKQSNVAKIVIGYSLVVWVLIQLIEAVLPTFETPLWVAQTLTFLLILGFPIALLVGWAYEKLPTQSTGTDGAPSAPQPAHSTPKKTLVLVGIGSCAVIGLFGFYMMPFIFDKEAFSNDSQDIASPDLSPRQNYRAFRAGLNLGETGVRVFHNTETDIAISPDGMTLAFLRHGASTTSELFIKDLGSPDSEKLLGNINGQNGSGLMFFSEDGNWLYFISGGTLNRTRIEGGAFQTLGSEIRVLRSGYSTLDDEVIFSDATDNKLYSISSSGLVAEPLPIDETAHLSATFTWPYRLPEKDFILVTTSDTPETVGIGSIDLYNVITGETRTLIEAASNARYVRSGHIIFMREEALWAVPFDVETKEITGLEVPVIQGIETNSDYGHATYAISGAGRLVYLPGDDGALSVAVTQLSKLTRTGELELQILNSQQYGHARVSPSGDSIAVTVYEQDGKSDIWVYDLSRKTLGRRTFEGKASRSIWSDDGNYLIYTYGSEGLRSVAANGTEPPTTVINTIGVAKPTSVTASGDIIFDNGAPLKIYRIPKEQVGPQETTSYELELAPSYNPNPLAAVSPDGNWIAYTSTESSERHIFVRPYPEIIGGKWQVSVEPGWQAIWNKSENEIFYWSDDDRQYSVRYEVGEELVDGRPNLIEFDVPQQIFSRIGINGPQTVPAWDYSPEDDSFIFLEGQGVEARGSASSLTELVVVENWFEELKTLAPPDQI